MLVAACTLAAACTSKTADTSSDTSGPADTDGADDTGDDTTVPDTLWYEDRVLNIAHRGGGRLAPEATMPAYENAVSLGVDVIEMDLHSTSDGVIVCMHDDTVDDTTDGTGLIHEFTYAELMTLDAGYHYTPDGGATHPWRGQGVVVPTMDEVLDAFPEMAFSIELKQAEPSIATEVVEALVGRGIEEQVVVSAFNQAAMDELRAEGPTLQTAMGITETALLMTEGEEPDYTPPSGFAQVPRELSGFEVLTPEFMPLAERHGIRVHVWTVNNADEMREVIAMGVHGIFSDDPALLKEVLAE
jgi:glycerophosphoryl diester phosphodiesterase